MGSEQSHGLPFMDELPSGWDVTAFGRILDGGTRNGIYKKKEFHGEGAKIVNMGELFAYPRLHAVPMKRLSLTATEADRFLLCEGDLLFARRSLVAEGAGKCSVVCEVSEPTTFESSIIRARPDSTQADSLFLYYLFSSPLGVHLLQTIRRQTSVSGITGTDLVKLNIPVPPLPEQKAIAHILGSLDDKIELNRKMNETLEAMARAIFKSWFVDFDPVRAKAEGRQPEGMDAETAALFPDAFEESELGLIPKGWRLLPLYDTATFVNGAAFKSKDFCAPINGLPIIKIAELKNGITAQTRWSQRELKDTQVIDTGDLLYSWSGSPDTSLEAFLWTGGKGLLNQHIFNVIAPDAVSKAYVYYLLHYLRPILVATAKNKQTTGLGHVTVADMKRLMVTAMPDDIRPAFEMIFSPIFDEAFQRTLESASLCLTRDALLPKLLSGQIRIKDAEKFVEDAA